MVDEPVGDQSVERCAQFVVPSALAPERSTQYSRGRPGIGMELEQMQQHAIVDRSQKGPSTRRLGLLGILDHFVADAALPADVERIQMPASRGLEAPGCRRFAATERHDHVRHRTEGRRIAVLVRAVLRVVVRNRDGHLVLLREVDDVAEQESLRAGSRGVGDPMGLEAMLPRVDDHPHRTQERDEPG